MAIEPTRSLRGLLAAALAVDSASAIAGEITLFQNRDFRGTPATLQSPMLNLEKNGFTTASSAVVSFLSRMGLYKPGGGFSGYRGSAERATSDFWKVKMLSRSWQRSNIELDS